MSESDIEDDYGDDSAAPGRPGLPIDFVRIIRGIVRRWRWLVIGGVVSAIIGVVLAKTIAPKTFLARTAILWEPGPARSRNDLSTLVDSIMIPANLVEIKKRLKLGAPIEALALRVQVFFDPNSDIVSIEASGPTAPESALLANTVVSVFLEYCTQLNRSRAERVVQELKASLEIARASLQNAQEVYDTFRRENNFIDVSAETTQAIEAAANLRSQAELARSDAQAEQARARQLENNARHERTTVVMSSSQVDSNAAAMSQIQTELATARSRLSPDHPRVQALEAQLSALRERGGVDVQRNVTTGQNTHLGNIKAAIAESASAREAAIQRQQTYNERAAEARQRLQALSAVEGQAAILLSEVTNAASHVTDLEGRVGPAEEAMRNATAEFRLMAVAENPPHAAHGKGKLYAAGIPGGALALLLLIIIGIELRGLRVHTAREAAFWLNAPAVGASQWPRIPEALNELLDELGDCAATSSGDTLVIGATPGDEAAARQIAAGLAERARGPAGGSEWQAAGQLPAGDDEPERTTLSEIAGPKGSAIAVTKRETQIQKAQPTAASSTAIRTWEAAQKSSVTLRRASRLSDRVLIVLTSNTLSALRLNQLPTKLGRAHGLGVVVIGLPPDLAKLPDRVGDVDAFWLTAEYEPGA